MQPALIVCYKKQLRLLNQRKIFARINGFIMSGELLFILYMHAYKNQESGTIKKCLFNDMHHLK